MDSWLSDRDEPKRFKLYDCGGTMKTSVIEVHDMLSVWAVEEVEKRIGKVEGVKSATVNFAAGNATVRYDETRLEIANIKSAVRQSGYESDAPAAAAGDDKKGHEGHTAASAPPATAAPTTAPIAPKAAPVAPATASAAPPGAASPDKASPDKASPDKAPPDKAPPDKN